MRTEEPETLWLFGYGSLLWRPDFDYEQKVHGYVVGWARRFWQGSTDHRGVPEAPGRVVTLIEAAGAECWGTAYKVARSSHPGVLAELDRREQGGYRRRVISVNQADGRAGATLRALVYVAGPENPDYLGEAPLSLIARQVAQSRGPSGANADYVLQLAGALRAIGAYDSHVFDLEAELKALTKTP